MRRNGIMTAIAVFLFATLSASAAPMKFVYYDEYMPRSYVKNGKMTGIIVDIIDEAVKKRMGIDVVHEGYPWPRAQLMVEKGLADAFVTVPTAERLAYTYASKEPLFKFETFIAAMKNSPKLEQLKQIRDLEGLKKFSLVDYYGNGWAKNVLKDHNVTWLPDYLSVFQFLERGNADAVMVSDISIFTIKRLGYADKIIVLKDPLTSVGFYLCVGKNSPYAGILDQFDKVILQMRKEGVIDRIIAKYYQE